MPVLRIENLSVSYGHIEALRDVTLSIPKGKIISIIGSNGAGKSTLLNTISGLVKYQEGRILFENEPLTKVACKVVRKGIVQIPEGRQIFPGLTVKENLLAGAYIETDKALIKRLAEQMFDSYPILRERQDQQAGTLSGGEQQMLAICRGLMSSPSMVLLDEPSLGLAPIIVTEVFEQIERICREQGITIVLVEQNANQALSLADYGYVLENGRIVLEGEGCDLLCNEEIRKAYLGTV
jgi:branched-chain amino acid transport system ATP-binding protein